MPAQSAKILGVLGLILLCLGQPLAGRAQQRVSKRSAVARSAVAARSKTVVPTDTVAPRDTARMNAVGSRIVRHAKKDVGFQERTNRNDHPIYSYYRQVARLGDKRDRHGKYLPTCGAAVYTWHIAAGVRPAVKQPGTALSWSTSAKRSQRYELGPTARPATVAKLRPGMVVSFRFKNQNHVGILEQVLPLYGVTDEANTSTGGSIGYYRSTKYGVICKIRFYAITKEAIDWRGSPQTDSLVAINTRKRYITPRMDSIRAARLSQPPPVVKKKANGPRSVTPVRRTAKLKPKPKPDSVTIAPTP